MKLFKKKDKKERIKMTIWSKICIVLSIVIMFGLAYLTVEAETNTSLADFIWLYFRNPVYDFLFFSFQHLSFIGINYYKILIGLFIIFCIIEVILKLFKKIKFVLRNKWCNIIYKMYAALIILFFVPALLITNYVSCSRINEKYFSDNIDKVYTKSDLIKLTNYFKDMVMDMSDDFERKDGSIIYKDDYVDAAVNDLKNISDEFLFLKGYYPRKTHDFSIKERMNNSDGTLGYVKSFNVFVDENQNNVALLNTITHEMCHVKGIDRESEAELCSVVANTKSDNKFSRYSGFYNAFYRLKDTLSYMDQSIVRDIEEDFVNLCLKDSYMEACEFYAKNVYNYINGSTYMKLNSYKLRNYVGYEEKFMYILNNLVSNYSAELIIDDKYVADLEIIEYLIEDGSEEVLTITFDIDKSIYESVSGMLEKNQKYFLAIYQYNGEFEYGSDLEAEEAEEFYLKPFKENDLKLNEEEYDDEYGYDRSVRLFLEYYDNVLE